jgi:transcriptional regulator with XRE-family HTH domain
LDPKNREFIDLMEAAGWSQAETARRLHLNPASISQFVNGKNRPATSTIQLMKLVIAQDQPEALNVSDRKYTAALEPWAKDLVDRLRQLPEPDRARLLPIIIQMIQSLQVARTKPAKSKY